MSRRLLILLAVAGLLAAALGLERLRPAGQTDLSAPDRQPQQDTPQSAEGLAINPVARLDPDTFDPMFELPLFSPARTAAAGPPDAEAATEGTAEAAPPAEPAPEPPPEDTVPILLGTVAQPQPGWAFLSAGPGDEAHFVAVGQDFDGWRVQAVGPDWVDLTGRDGPKRLSFPDPAQAGGTVAP